MHHKRPEYRLEEDLFLAIEDTVSAFEALQNLLPKDGEQSTSPFLKTSLFDTAEWTEYQKNRETEFKSVNEMPIIALWRKGAEKSTLAFRIFKFNTKAQERQPTAEPTRPKMAEVVEQVEEATGAYPRRHISFYDKAALIYRMKAINEEIKLTYKNIKPPLPYKKLISTVLGFLGFNPYPEVPYYYALSTLKDEIQVCLGRAEVLLQNSKVYQNHGGELLELYFENLYKNPQIEPSDKEKTAVIFWKANDEMGSTIAGQVQKIDKPESTAEITSPEPEKPHTGRTSLINYLRLLFFGKNTVSHPDEKQPGKATNPTQNQP